MVEGGRRRGEGRRGGGSLPSLSLSLSLSLPGGPYSPHEGDEKRGHAYGALAPY